MGIIVKTSQAFQRKLENKLKELFQNAEIKVIDSVCISVTPPSYFATSSLIQQHNKANLSLRSRGLE